ncbi:hypothetical protein ACA910_017770 [Epithemia clementina (nom. ined.)]
MMINPYAKKRRTKAINGTGAGCDDERKNEPVSESAKAASSCCASAKSSSAKTMSSPRTLAESASALVIAATDKAGMDGIDRASIDKIILRESGSSLYMQQQRKRDQQVDQRIDQIRNKLSEEELKNPNWRRKLQNFVDKELSEAIGKQPNRSTCVVVDMDMFFMACELLTRPDLVDKPACVGGSMITTSNYVARRYGVRSAMAGWIGDKLVEELSGGKEKLIHVKSNFALYKEKSLVVKTVLAEYDPTLSMHSLDEAFLDLAPYLALKMAKNWSHEQIRNELQKNSTESTTRNQSTLHDWEESQTTLASFPAWLCRQHASEVIEQMREKVKKETGGLTCSAGLAPNFLLAKIASDQNKPNGQCIVDSSHEQILQFLHPLPTRKVSGIGRVTEKTLRAFGIKTVEQLYKERALVRFLFKPATAGFLARASVGCSSSEHRAPVDDSAAVHGQKGISRERTFPSGESWTAINARLEDIGRLLSSDMEKKNLWARTVTVKVKLHTFDVYSRARSMPHSIYLQNAEDLVSHAAELLREIRSEVVDKRQFSVRLLGIRCSNFRGDEGAGQINIEKFLEAKQPNTVDSTSTKVSSSRAVTPSSRAPERSVTGGQREKEDDASLPRRAHVSCPICQANFSEDNNYELNQHIDACLSGRVVRNVLREQRSLDAAKSKSAAVGRKRRITDFYGSTTQLC